MKIMICASVSYAKEMLSAKKLLERDGHTVLMTDDIKHHAEHPQIKSDISQEMEFIGEQNFIDEGFKKISECDAILVLNYEKNGIKGYLGTAVLMEVAVAYYLKKKIYLLNEIDKKQRYSIEIHQIKPSVINRDFSKIK